MKIAHITNRPEYELGDKVLALCGEEFKVKVKWADLPDDKPVCRACIDLALRAMTEADKIIESSRTRVRRLSLLTQVLSEVLDESLILDEIAETDLAFQDEVAQRKRDKAEEKLAKKTCTCNWASTGEISWRNPDCPIHGGHLDAEPVELPEATE